MFCGIGAEVGRWLVLLAQVAVPAILALIGIMGSLRPKSFQRRNRLVIVACVVLFLFSLATAIWNQILVNKREELFASSLASRVLPKMVPIPPITITTGGGGATLILDQVDALTLSPMGPWPKTIAVISDGTLYIEGDIRDSNGRVVASIANSKVYAPPAFCYDSNSDDSALEVVDPDQHPVFQVSIGKDLRTVYLRFISQYSPHQWYLCDESGCIHDNDPATDLRKRAATWQTMFRYPSADHNGQRRDNGSLS